MAAGFGIEPNRASFKGSAAHRGHRPKMKAGEGLDLRLPGQSRLSWLLNEPAMCWCPETDLHRQPSVYRTAALLLCYPGWGDVSVSIRSVAGSQPAGFACSLTPPSKLESRPGIEPGGTGFADPRICLSATATIGTPPRI